MTYDMYETILFTFFLLITGLAIGSFLNVVIYRIPNKISLAGRSACPNCGTQIKEYDNIPVLSWVILKARCRHCKTSISSRYPAVEIFTAGAFLAVGLWNGFNPYLAPLLIFMSLSIALFMIDLDTLKLPNALTLTSLILLIPSYVVIGIVEGESSNIIRGILGGLTLGMGYALLWLVTRGKGLGLGDVKLVPTLGFILAYYGWENLIIGTFFSWLIGGIIGVILLLVGKAGRKTQIPFGPYLIIGTWIGIIFGSSIWVMYSSFL